MKILRKPVIRVTGPTGVDLVGRWGQALLGVTITDHAGHESDECVIRLRRAPPWDAPPPTGARYTVEVGWAGAGLAMTGVYTTQRHRISGSPEEGEEIEVVCRAADFLDKGKAVDSEHFDEENGHGTAGKIFETLAARMGVEAVVDAEIAAVAVPYRLRWRQSAIDFASELADDVGAVAKPQAGKLVVTKRGGGSSASGKALPPVHVVYDESYAFDVNGEPRGSYAKTSSPWFDGEAGRDDVEEFDSASATSASGDIHPAPSKEEAKSRASAAGDAQARGGLTGSFEMAGNAAAVAGAPLIASGFGAGVDDVDWRIGTVTHDITPDVGWVTTVEVETKPKKKEEKKKAAT
ncbi:hypothetical protein [Methylopila sp. 73B]|uniref:hypothetical protein n=1 Tax=Methylopila sp. 73B TaxID=1120792 RepID=UPI00037F01C8|nr:hypothetical protein [Methylopila sp. 73B]